MSKFRKVLFYPSALVLIFVNTIPLLGVLFYAWDVTMIITLYWMESAVIGFFNIFKMKAINSNNKFKPEIPFFIVHYSMFMFGHFLFIVSLNIFKPDFGEVGNQFEAFSIVLDYFSALAVALFFMFLSHAISFFYNFMDKKEFVKQNMAKQMVAPYKRIFVMHMVLIFGSWSIVGKEYQYSIVAIAILVVLKTLFDLAAHVFEHRKNIFT